MAVTFQSYRENDLKQKNPENKQGAQYKGYINNMQLYVDNLHRGFIKHCADTKGVQSPDVIREALDLYMKHYAVEEGISEKVVINRSLKAYDVYIKGRKSKTRGRQKKK